jgi:hypothetical protein
LKKTKDEACMKRVAGAGGIDGGNLKCWRVMELLAIPREHPIFS